MLGRGPHGVQIPIWTGTERQHILRTTSTEAGFTGEPNIEKVRDYQS